MELHDLLERLVVVLELRISLRGPSRRWPMANRG